jgi:hypothetical protein
VVKQVDEGDPAVDFLILLKRAVRPTESLAPGSGGAGR